MKKLGNPGIFTLMGFGYSVAIFGVQQLFSTPALIGAAVYGLLVGAISEFIGGMWCFARGDTYIGSVASTFGAWLIGYFFLITQGSGLKLFTPISSGVFCLVLIPPVYMLMIPAMRMHIKALTTAFIFLIGLLLFTGLANLPVGNKMIFQRIGGVCSLVSAITLWYIAWGSVKEMLSEMTAGAQ